MDISSCKKLNEVFASLTYATNHPNIRNFITNDIFDESSINVY